MSDISCETCIGACCSNVRLTLTAPEAERLKKAGTNLRTLLQAYTPPLEGEPKDDYNPPFNWADEADAILESAGGYSDNRMVIFYLKVAARAREMKPGEGLYLMDGRCGNLQDDNRCGDYNNRPAICQDFPMGEVACQNIRLAVGVDVPVALTTKTVNSEES